MANGTVVTNNGRIIVLNRTFTASPSYTVPSVFSVGTGTNTPVLADTALQTLVQISGSDTKAIAAGYPILDETTKQCTIRCLLLTTECNGSSLSEFGLKNTDGTAKLFSRCVHTAITKTSQVSVVYVEKDRITQ